MRWECRERFTPPPTSTKTASQRSRHASRHVRDARAVMHVGIAYPWWRGKRSRHSRRMRTRNFTNLAKGPWWRCRMEAFSALPALCAEDSQVTGEFPSQRPVTRSFDVFFGLRLNKGVGKQWRRRWFEMPSRPLWRHCNGLLTIIENP